MPSKIFFIKLFCLFYASIIQAEIITDGTLGERIHLHAPNYDITEDLGQQVGRNLFHSFAQFNLHPGQTATFFGTNDIHNIITRVTGGEASLINGRLVSNIPDANFYLINPYGITFGKNTHLDIQGSFHATTADYVKLEDNSEFHARYPEKTILSVADVHSFGFLTEQAAAITIRSNGKLAAEPDKRANMLHLKPNSTLSLIGGDINVLQGSYIKTLNEAGEIERLPQIDIAGGNIFLVAVASQGEVIVDPEIDTGVDVSTITRFANIALRDYSEIRASGQNDGSIHLIGKQVMLDNGSHLSIDINNNTETSGSVLIRAEQFLLTRGSQIQASTTGRSEGMLMRIEAEDVQLSGYDSELKQPSTIYQETQTNIDSNESIGILEIDAGNISLDDGSSIYTNTLAKKTAPELSIKAREQLILQGNNIDQSGSNIYSYSNATTEHDSGQILISAQNLTLLDGAFIGVETFGKGSGGDIFIKNTGNITIRGTDKLGQASQILADAYPRDKKTNVGDAGDIFINAQNLTLEQGGNISSSVIAREKEVVGNSGKIEIILTGDLHISGINPHGELIDGISSGIRVQAREVGGKTGVAGNIDITAANVTIQHGGEINTNTTGNSNAGNIVMNATQITVSGYATDDDLTRPMTTAQQAFKEEFPEQVKTSPYVSSISASTSEYYPRTTGNAGTIEINVNQLEVNNAGVITNQTGNLGGGGNITITAQDIDVEKGGSITSQTIGGGHAGNIDINAEGVIRLFGTDSSGADS